MELCSTPSHLSHRISPVSGLRMLNACLMLWNNCVLLSTEIAPHSTCHREIKSFNPESHVGSCRYANPAAIRQVVPPQSHTPSIAIRGILARSKLQRFRSRASRPSYQLFSGTEAITWLLVNIMTTVPFPLTTWFRNKLNGWHTIR